MKKTLFYVVLFIFAASSVVTLAGVSGYLQIQEKYLDKLIWAFLGQLAAAVISLFRNTDFFSEEATKRLESTMVQVNSAVMANKSMLQIGTGAHANSTGAENSNVLQIEAVGIYENTIEEYFECYAKIKNRPLERDQWIAKMNGRSVDWIGVFSDVKVKNRTINLFLHSKKDVHGYRSFLYQAPISFKDMAYSFREGDVIRVKGILDLESMPDLPFVIGDQMGRI